MWGVGAETPFSDHRQALEVGWVVALWPMSRAAVAALSRPSCFRVSEAAWWVGYGGDMASTLPSAFRHSRYQGSFGAGEKTLTVGVWSLWGSGPRMCSCGWVLRTRTRKSRAASASLSLWCRPDSRRLSCPVVATSQPQLSPGSGGRGHRAQVACRGGGCRLCGWGWAALTGSGRFGVGGL